MEILIQLYLKGFVLSSSPENLAFFRTAVLQNSSEHLVLIRLRLPIFSFIFNVPFQQVDIFLKSPTKLFMIFFDQTRIILRFEKHSIYPKITEVLRKTHGDHPRATSELRKVFYDHLRIMSQLEKNNVYGLEVFQKFEKKKDYSRLLD